MLQITESRKELEVTLEKLDGYHSQRLEKVRVPLRTCAIVAPARSTAQERAVPFGAQTKGAAEEESTTTVSTTGGKDGFV